MIIKQKIPLVSILCVTYNQENYIEEAIKSFIMQKTSFTFEVIIHDDASTDGTQKIIRKYVKEYPDILKPMYEENNQFSQGNDQFIHDMFIAAKGKYIAACEGDDFWTDPNKLQLQVNFLEKNADYSICFHPVRVFFEKNEEKEYVHPNVSEYKNFDINNLLKRNFIQSNSVMYRKQHYDDMKTGVTPMDWYTHLFHAQFGQIGLIDKVMSAYRRHSGGIWWQSDKDIDEIWKKYGVQHYGLYIEMLEMFGSNTEYKDIIDSHIGETLETFMNVDEKHNTQILKSALEIYPGSANKHLFNLHRTVLNQKQIIAKNSTEITNLKEQIKMKDEMIAHKTRELELIKASKVWKLRNKTAKFVGKKPV